MSAAVLECAAAAAMASPGWARTRRLVLREFSPDDVDALVAMHRDARLREHLIDDFPLDRPAVSRTFVERLAPLYRRHEGLGIWHASVLEPAPAFAGWFSLMPVPGIPGEVEIGSRLVPQAWGHGIALEGGEMLLDHAFDDLGLAQVRGFCHPDNRSARAVLAALGFEASGLVSYDAVQALDHRIALNAWRTLRNIPRGTRLRRALRAVAAGRARSDPTEEPLHAHEIDPGPPA